jgi:hypothetical protein
MRVSRGVWIMSQSISNQRSGYWPLRRQLRLKCVVWGDDFTFGTSNVNLHCGFPGRPIDPMAADASGDGVDP